MKTETHEAMMARVAGGDVSPSPVAAPSIMPSPAPKPVAAPSLPPWPVAPPGLFPFGAEAEIAAFCRALPPCVDLPDRRVLAALSPVEVADGYRIRIRRGA